MAVEGIRLNSDVVATWFLQIYCPVDGDQRTFISRRVRKTFLKPRVFLVNGSPCTKLIAVGGRQTKLNAKDCVVEVKSE